jgi:hypothetical protein
MPDSGEGGQGRGGNRVEEFARVYEVLGQPPAHLEVKLRLLLAGHVAVHVLDLRLQSLTLWDLLNGGAAGPRRPAAASSAT